MSNFVTLTKEQFEENLPELMSWDLVEVPNCKEFVYDIPSPVDDVSVRIYSTIDVRTNTTRSIGSDAIRVVFWDKVNNRPIGKGKKILRVEGATSIGDRLNARIAEFFDNVDNVEILDFGYVEAVLSHDSISWMDFASSLLDQLVERGSLTDKQLAWVLGDKNPKGRKTMEAQVLAADPEFKDQWVNEESEPDEPEVDPVQVDIQEQLRHNENVLDEKRRIGSLAWGSAPVHEPEPEPETSIKLVKTKKYKPYKYSFGEFNPVQSEVLPLAKKDCNLVIGANTSAGKTICAEFLMDATLAKGERVIYLSPLKALTQEKYEDWKVRFSDFNISILTGDYTLSEKRKKELAKADIIVMTSEMCDSRTRRMKSEKNYWLNEVGLVVVDESHILTTDRGHAVEAGIMRFTSINKMARILFLSATMPNCNELAEWLYFLNGKSSKVVYSTWRPVVLNIDYVSYTPAMNDWGREDYWSTQALKLSMAVELAMSKPDEKFLIFVHDKGTGRRIVKALEKVGETAYFHNADLDLNERLEVESKFEDRDNGIRVLVSTSTLAWGRNLPARNVVVVGIHRGLIEVDELDIIQMSGRAGRYGIDDEGFVSILLPIDKMDLWIEKFVNPRPVNSVLYENIHFHAIAEIDSRTVQDSETLAHWYSRSLADFQSSEKMDETKAEQLLNTYSEMEMIEGDGIRIFPTGLGRVCAWLYFHPSDVYRWYKNFEVVFNTEILNTTDEEMLISWAIGDIPSNNMGFIPKPIKMDAEEFMFHLLNEYSIRSTEAVVGAMTCYHAITGNKEIPDYLKSFKRKLIFDIERVNKALSLIDSQYAMWNKKNFWSVLPQRVKYGVPAEVADLTRIDQIGGAKAMKLYENGFTTIEEIANSTIKNLCKVMTPALAKKIKHRAEMLSS